ncbi:uncharacterized protein PHALS_01799 [Plasmopara halstedii]|uniref:Uncharacterized protein n=1 Tax=Plasmopara halstedii TaxID=4781 RepID=A0A0P1ATR5_PLAHL|nr:uncharacterized protein PHALS_01799 [Plasmopara halstedii]CEG45508.1 hypothetical protein PHALS_01799 [Plasmopara halstedii]|eukprot:XP_024581877.1 hypothetical protein PHALS_01799 [Plasmopara halstedii]
MEMKLARKMLRDHVMEMKSEAHTTLEWRASDTKEFAIIAQGIQLGRQSKNRSARNAREAWEILTGESMASHLNNLNELIVAMKGVGDEKLKEILLDEVKEKLLKEHEKIENAEKSEESEFKVRLRNHGGRRNIRGGRGRQDQHIRQDMRQGGLSINCTQ